MRILFFLLFPIFLSAQINRAYGVIEIGATFPTSSATGPKFAYRTVDSSFYRFVSGSTWIKIIPDEFMPLDSLVFTPSSVEPDTAELKYSQDLETFVFGADGTVVEIGQKEAWYVKNQSGSTINKGTVVRAAGTLGSSGRILIEPMEIDGTVNSKYLLGITASNIANGADGYVIHFGKLRKFNTSAWTDGAVLYVGAAGGLTAIEPNPPNLRLPIAFVVHSHAVNGVLAVRIQTGNMLDELHDVDTTGIDNDGVLVWDGSKWEASDGAAITTTDTTSLLATKYWTNSNFFPLEGGTLTGTGGAGFIGFPSQVSAPGTPASGLNVFAQGSSFNWKGTDGYERQFASTLTGGRTYTLPDVSGTFALGTGTTNRVPLWTATNTLGSSNIQDNNTAVSILNSKPFQLGQWTTAGRPSGILGYIGFNTSNNYPEFYNGSAWDEIYTPWQRGSSYTYYGADLGSTRYDVQISGTQTVGLGIIKDVDYYGMEVGESATKAGGFYWRNALERVEFTTFANAFPIAFGNNWAYFATDGKVGLGNTSPQRTLHVTGETRLTDLTTDPPTRLVGADADGDLGEVTAGNGITITNSTINSGVGLNWTNTAISGSPQFIGICYGNNRFVAVSFNGKFFTSTDGRSWIERTAPAANQWTSVAFGNGIFVAVSYNGTNRVATSNDGITWTARSAAEANQWISVTYGGNQFVAVSDNGTNRVMTSSDGITWTARSAVSSSWYRIQYANGLYVAVAYSGTNRVMTSPDGIAWTARTAAEANEWRGVTYANGLWVAVSSNGTNRVMTSPDATTWTARTLVSGTWYDVTFGNSLFVACDNSGGVSTSTDGITWTTRTGGGGRAIIFEETMFVSVLFSGSVSTSGAKTIRQPFNNKTNGFQSWTGDLNFRGRRVFSASADTTASSYWGSLYNSETKRNGYFIRDSVLGSEGINYVFAAHRNGIAQGQVSQFSTNSGVIGEHTRFGTTSGSAARYFYGRDDFTSSKTSTGATINKRSGIQFRGTFGKADTVFFSVNDQYMGLDTVSRAGGNYASNRSIFLAFNPDGSYQSAGHAIGTDGETGTGVPVLSGEQNASYRIGKLINSGGLTTHEFSALYMPVSWSKVTDAGGAMDYVVLGEVLKLSASMAQLYNYGTGTKEAADLSKTESAYIAKFATDGTLIEKPDNTERYNTITSTTSPVTLSSTIADNLINQGSTQATFTFRLPASPVNGQISKATFANAVTVLTIDGNGTTVTGTLPTTVNTGQQIIFKNYTGLGWVRQL